jgi:hypothetical protein
MRFPGIEPVVNRDPIDLKYVSELIRCLALMAEQNTLCPLPHAVILAFLIDPLEHLSCFRTYIMHEAHRFHPRSCAVSLESLCRPRPHV